jgi:TfoX/Sxy family transcriptional regulator of competence genes
MAYSEILTEKVRSALAGVQRVEEKRMFGSLAFMVNKKMCINVGRNRVMFRIDPAIHENALKIRGCRAVVMKGREYKGYVYVSEQGVETKEDFDFWVKLALGYNKKANASTRKKHSPDS